jgi:teichuronic acid biosynthesis glycosyltransferase TuaG
MERNIVSVIMPVYNGANHIHDAIESVINQTYASWELLISDDVSTDESLGIALSYAELDPRIVVLSGLVRGGPAVARNRAIDEANGGWLAFLDSDDTWHPEKLSQTLEFAQTNELALAYTDYTRLAGSRSVVVRAPRAVTYRKLLHSNVVATSTVLVDRHLVPWLRMNEEHQPDDFIAWLEILREGLRAGGLSIPLTNYRKSAESHSGNKRRAALRVLRVLRYTQRLSWPEIIWYFLNYAIRGAFKHSFLVGLSYPRKGTS